MRWETIISYGFFFFFERNNFLCSNVQKSLTVNNRVQNSNEWHYAVIAVREGRGHKMLTEKGLKNCLSETNQQDQHSYR